MNPRNSHSREVRELTSEKTGKIYGINGPVIYLKGRMDLKCRRWSMSERNALSVR